MTSPGSAFRLPPAAPGSTVRGDGPRRPDMSSDAETTLQALKDKVLAFAHEREWEQFHTPKNLSMAIAAEAAELMEHFLWKRSGDDEALLEEPARRQKITEELADIIIFSLEFANITGIDLATAIEAKMRQNARKYPVEKARGRADKYTEL